MRYLYKINKSLILMLISVVFLMQNKFIFRLRNTCVKYVYQDVLIP